MPSNHSDEKKGNGYCSYLCGEMDLLGRTNKEELGNYLIIRLLYVGGEKASLPGLISTRLQQARQEATVT